MPIYEYRCSGCDKLNSVFIRSFALADDAPSPKCSRCGGSDLRKLVSRFSVARSEEARLDSLADMTQYADIDPDDPKSVTRFAKKLGTELGEDLGDDFHEAIEQVESGKEPLSDTGGSDGLSSGD